MEKNTGILIGVVAVVVVVGGVYFTMSKDTSTVAENTMLEKQPTTGSAVVTQPAPAEGQPATESESATGADAGETATMQKDEAPEAKEVMVAGSYEAYAPEKIALAETGDVVLFFHASWCPSCRGLNADIEKNRSAIPSGVTILKVDYDKETELKKKYGVTTQHTLVQVDAQGAQIKKWSGGSQLSAVVSELQ